MKTGHFLTRDAAIAYLTNQPAFLRLYVNRRGVGRSLDDLGRAQAIRYGNRMYQAVTAGVDTSKWRDLGPLRGHEYSEHHKEPTRKPRKAGYEGYVPPARVKMGRFYSPNAEGKIVSQVTLTRGERTAERAILDGIRHPVHGVARQVAINVTGGKPGQYAQLFWHGGWNAEALLTAAGWKRRPVSGHWYRPAGALGLEDMLINYLTNLADGRYNWWGSIAMYEVYVYDEPVREVADPRARLAAGSR